MKNGQKLFLIQQGLLRSGVTFFTWVIPFFGVSDVYLPFRVSIGVHRRRISG